jgi:hypothetical protein
MFIVNVAIPDPASKIYTPTRLVIGCGDQAEMIGDMLHKCGMHTEVNEVVGIPERGDDEIKRASELMVLLFAQNGGHA